MEAFLHGRTALVTGSTSGIGLAIATALGAAGMRVAISGLGEPEQIDKALEDITAHGGEARHFPADLRAPEQIQALLLAVSAWSPIDVLVNNAGIQHAAPLSAQLVQAWDDVLAINLSAAFHTMQGVLPGMAARGYGRVINIASVHGLVASVDKAPYVASKFGLVGLTKVAALECAAHGNRESGGVTVNCICPGWVETALIEPQILARAGDGDRAQGVRALLQEKQPSLRMSLPQDIADAVVWLCQRAAHNLTGSSIPIDGGWTAQ